MIFSNKSDTDGEVIFLRIDTLINQVFKHLANVNRAYFGLRQQYQKWRKDTKMSAIGGTGLD
jgi:hypothetical protein